MDNTITGNSSSFHCGPERAEVAPPDLKLWRLFNLWSKLISLRESYVGRDGSLLYSNWFTTLSLFQQVWQLELSSGLLPLIGMKESNHLRAAWATTNVA